MPELFDMIAGSETGAMIGSALVVPNLDPATNKTQINKFWASDLSEYFKNNASHLYVDQQMPFLTNLLILVFAITLVSALTYYCFDRKYKLKAGYLETMEKLSLMIESYTDYLNIHGSKKTDDKHY